jgi:hypothetical protein
MARSARTVRASRHRATRPTAARQAYEWDIFISYPHEPLVRDWVDSYFVPLLTSTITNHIGLNPPVRIFKDRPEIRTGDEWRLKLGNALQSSICLVPILTASYFQSAWCKAEWEAFVRRERSVGLPSKGNPRGLIAPVKFGDGDHFPRHAMSRQIFDMSDWAYPSPALKESREYLDFMRGIRDFTQDLATRHSPLMTPPPMKRVRLALPGAAPRKLRVPMPRYR